MLSVIEPEDNTEWFLDAFCGVMGGSPTAECGCGRTLYSDSEYYDEGEREALDHRARRTPSRTVYLGYDSVSHREINGVTYVEGCPCKGLERLEAFLWSEREAISKYIHRRAAYEAEELRKAADRLAGISELP